MFHSILSSSINIGLLNPSEIVDELLIDQNSLDWFKNYLKNFNQNGGSVMLVTHQHELGLELANRVLFLHNKSLLHDLKADSLNEEDCKAILNG